MANAVSTARSTVGGAGFNSPTSARKMVLVAMLGLTVINFYRSRTPESDVNLFRRLWGTGVLGLMLSVLADFAPTVAGPFALLVLLGSLTNGGDKAIQNALGKISAPQAATPVGKTAQGTVEQSGGKTWINTGTADIPQPGKPPTPAAATTGGAK